MRASSSHSAEPASCSCQVVNAAASSDPMMLWWPTPAAGFYVHGEPYDEQLIRDAVTPEAAGYVKEQVRCENCVWYKSGKCGLFALLNSCDPGAFDCDPKVKAKACCNGWQAR